jgi:hypothetical protein
VPHKDPEARRAYQREYKRGARAGEPSNPASTPRLTLLPAGFRLKAASDVLALLEEQVEAVRADETAGTLERARCIGYLAGVSLRAIETGELAARLEALERALASRPRGTA